MTPLHPADLRAALAAALILYLPGLPLARRLARSAGGSTLGWALPTSLALLLGGLFLARIVGLSLDGASVLLAALTLAMIGLAVADRFRRGGSAATAPFEELGSAGTPAGAHAGVPDPLDRIRPAEWILLIAAVLVLLAVGGPLYIRADSLDHVASIRRSLLSGSILPLDEFYKGGDGVGWDSRKGFLPALLAVVCKTSGTDPLNLWRVLPAVLAPALLLAIARLLRAWCGPGWRSDAALVTWVLVGSGSGFLWLTKNGYPNHVAYAVGFLAIALWLEQLQKGVSRGRLVAVGLVVFTSVLLHVVPGLLVGLALGLGALAFLLSRAGAPERLRTTLATGIAAAAGLLPPLVLRLLIQGPNASTLHTHPQGLLSLGGSLVVASPGTVLTQIGVVAPLALVLLPLAARRVRPVLRLPLLFLTLGPWLAVETPLHTPLRAVLGYLVVRFLEVTPSVPALILAAEEGFTRLRRPKVSFGLLYGLAALAAMVVLAGGAALRLPQWVRAAVEAAAGARTPIPFTRALEAVPRASVNHPGTPPVVLSDPFSSYAVAAYTGGYVVSTLNQHGPPNDARWRQRLEDQRDMLVGAGGEARMDSLLRAYGVEVVFVNTGLQAPMAEFGSELNARMTEMALHRYGGDPVRHLVVYRGPDGLVVRVWSGVGVDVPSAGSEGLTAGAGASTSGPASGVTASPGDEAWPPFPTPGRTSAVGPIRLGAIEAIDLQLPDEPLGRRTRAKVTLRWRRVGVVGTDLPLRVHLRCETKVPSRWYIQPAWSKLGRLLAESRDHHVYLFRRTALPFQGLRSLDRLPLGQAIPDTLLMYIPPGVAPGRYRVKISLLPEPFLQNLSLRDLLRDEDQYDGFEVGSITVR